MVDVGPWPGLALVETLSRGSRNSVWLGDLVGRRVHLDAGPSEVVDRLLEVFAEHADVPLAVVHGDRRPGNIRIGPDGSVGLLDWDESRVDLTWHDLSNLGIQVLAHEEHRRARRLSNAWEAANGWGLEPDYARHRLQLLDER